MQSFINDDIKIFFNDFSEIHNLDGKEIECIIDNDELKERSKKEFDGLSIGDLLIFVRANSINKLKQDQTVFFDNRPMIVMSIREDFGIYEIVLQQNVGG